MHTMMVFASKIRNMALNRLMSTPHSDSEAIALLPMLHAYITFGLFPPTLDQLFLPFQLSLLCFSIFRTLSILISRFLPTLRLW